MVMLAQLEIMTQNIKHTQQRTNEFAAKVEAVEISFQKHVEGKFTVVADSYEARCRTHFNEGITPGSP